MKLGLTGGIGCGKSTVGTLLQQQGWLRIDSDALVRELLDHDTAVQQALRAQFGPEVLLPAPAQAPQGGFTANRALIAGRIFNDPQERLWLEALLHPRVRELWQARAAAAGSTPVVIEIPLLFEKNLEKHFDLAVCVEADRHVQLARLQSRGMSPADAEARIASQMPLAEKIARADKVLSNNGTEDFLRTQVQRLNHELPATHPCTD